MNQNEPLEEYKENNGKEIPQLEQPSPIKKSWRLRWENIVRLGLGEISLRLGTAIASIALVLLVVWVMGRFYLQGDITESAAAVAAPLPTATQVVAMPVFELPDPGVSTIALSRYTKLHTLLPEKPRYDITEYTVVKGDTIIGIAEKFKLASGNNIMGQSVYLW